MVSVQKPRVSVLMPAFNSAAYIRESIESVLKQDYLFFELLILDDGSTDATWEIIREFKRYPRVRIFRQKHRGVAPARNRLMALARGEFLSPHDADDVMLPGKLRKQARILEKRPGVGVVFGDCIIQNEGMRPFWTGARPAVDTQRGRFLVPDIYHCSSLIRKKALLRAGGYLSRYTPGDDLDLWIRLSEITEFLYRKGPVYIWRRHPGSISHRLRHEYDAVHEDMLRQAVFRRNPGRIRLKVRIHEILLKVQTNSPAVRKAIRTFLYRDGRAEKESVVCNFEIYDVPYLEGIFRHLPFRDTGWGMSFYVRPGGSVVYWRSAENRFVAKLDQGGKNVLFFVENAGRLPPDFLVSHSILYPLIYLTRPMGWHFVHSAAVAKGSSGALIVGPSMAGKTTLSFRLVQRGCNLLSEETNIVQYLDGRFRLKGYPRKPQLKSKTLSRFPELAAFRDRFVRVKKNKAGNKWMVPVEALRKGARQPSANLKLVVLPEYRRGARAQVRSVAPEALFKCLRDDPTGYTQFGAHAPFLLDQALLFRSLSRKVPVYRCVYSDRSSDRLVDFVEKAL